MKLFTLVSLEGDRAGHGGAFFSTVTGVVYVSVVVESHNCS